MKNCNWCGIETKNPKFCSLSCGAKHQNSIALKPIKILKNICPVCQSKHNNKIYCSRSCSAKNTNQNRRIFNTCKYCKEIIVTTDNKNYCNRECAANDRYHQAVNRWLDGKSTGLTVNGVVNSTVKRWLRETRGDACEECGWNRVNQTTGKVPVVADHIDGNWQNNRPENLKLLCPSCDSLQPTYKALNKGNGRSNR